MSCINLCGNTECKSCFDKSFASIEKSKYLHDKTITPLSLKLAKNLYKKYDFDCNKCNHIFNHYI